MSLEVLHTGIEKTPVIVIDDTGGDPDSLVDYAASLAPFPAVGRNYFPGLQRVLTPDDAVGFEYVTAVCKSLATIMGRVYGIERFAVQDACFSLITTPPSELQLRQSLPHVDSPELNRFAVLHYLSHHEDSGTAFFRHISTGIETISYERLGPFTHAREKEIGVSEVPKGYIKGSAHGFEEIGRVEARFNRLVVYPSALFHSAIIPDDFDFSPDPRRGRLTGNIFLSAVTG